MNNEHLALLLEDPERLDAAAWAEALAAVRADPRRVRDQARLDEQLSRLLDPGRADLLAAVQQRIRPASRARFIRRVVRSSRPRRRVAPAFTAAVVMTGVFSVILAMGLRWWPTDASPRRTLGDGSRLVAADGAAWSESTTSAGVVVSLAAGGIAISAVPQAPGRALTVRTSHATIAVVGTEFAVAARPHGTEVTVTHGAVEVKGRRIADRRLHAGDALLVPAADGWRSTFADPSVLRNPPIAWWLGEPAFRDDSGRPQAVLAAARPAEETWVGVRAVLLGDYRMENGDRIHLRLHASAGTDAYVQVEHAGEARHFRHALSLHPGWNDVVVRLTDLTGILEPHRPLRSGDALRHLLICADGTPGAFALGSLTIEGEP